MRRQMIRALVGLGVIGLLATGCSVDTSELSSETVVPLQQATLDAVADKEIIGVGEASHGNREMVEVRRLVLEKLVTEHDVRTLALEADFGGAATANDYVLHDRGTAEEAAEALGFDMFKTEETADLLRWIHDHNDGASADDLVRVYGFDMQRYDHNKTWLAAYLKQVDPDQVAPMEKSLAGLTDETRVDQSDDANTAGAQAAQKIIDLFDANRDDYVAASSEEEFTLARHHAETIKKCAQLQSAGNDFGTKRDAWMAENIQWLHEFEQTQDRDQMMIGAHNGHIDKTGAALPFTTMGEALTKAYGDNYATIGTEFGKSTFVSRDAGSGERKEFHVDHDSDLAGLFGDEQLGYLDIAAASKQPHNRELLESTVRMGATDESYRSIYRFLSFTYTVKMVPADAYDALIYVPEAGPVTPLPER